MKQLNPDGTMARIAGNIAAGLVSHDLFVNSDANRRAAAQQAVEMAEQIIADVRSRMPVKTTPDAE